jgi:hypothetical protein
MEAIPFAPNPFTPDSVFTVRSDTALHTAYSASAPRCGDAEATLGTGVSCIDRLTDLTRL